MIIVLFQLSETEKDFNFEISPEEINLSEDSARLAKPVKITGGLKKRIAQVDVQGNITSEIEIDCTRCLSPTQTLLSFSFKAAFVIEENYTSDKEAELQAEDLDVAVFNGEEIDLSELAREQILLNLPTRFLCREDCKGLCEKCGANKNSVNCNCEETEVDPRWSVLKELKRNA